MSRNANDQGILSISFLPTDVDTVDIRPTIRELFLNSENIRASIAFWTLSFQDLLCITNDPYALRAMKSVDSFLCCDIQLPTNIDALAGLKQAGVDIYLNFRRLIPALRKSTSSLGLLHTKILLADKKDGTADLWIGSHNWTKPALSGMNTEVSVIMNLDRSGSMYNEAHQLLKYIRSFCDEFDLNMLDEYKLLQIKESIDLDTESVIIEMEGSDVNSLSNTSIWMFGTEDRDYSSLRRVGNDIKLILHETATLRKYLYKASIIQTGQMEAYNSLATGLQFTGQKRYSFSQVGMFPVLELPHPIPATVESDAMFFVAIHIMDKLSDDFEIYGKTENKLFLWEDAVSDPIINMNKVCSWCVDTTRGRKNNIKSLIQVPYFKDTASRRQSGKEEFLLQSIEIKRESREYQFVSKGVIKLNTNQNIKAVDEDDIQDQ